MISLFVTNFSFISGEERAGPKVKAQIYQSMCGGVIISLRRPRNTLVSPLIS